ncbi:hypothetical protein Celaphus_00017748, partial [Cervus elaphus hippelaphus]
MNENLFASFITPTIAGLPIVILIIIFLSMFFQTSNQQINNCLISFQQIVTTLIYTNYTINKSRHTSRNCNHELLQSLAHFLPEGTPISLIPILVSIETLSLFILQIRPEHLIIHLIGGATLTLISIRTTTALISFIILALFTILEFAVAIIQAYVFMLLPLWYQSYEFMTASQKEIKSIYFKLFYHNHPGIYLTPLQDSEYYKTSFTISDGVYGSTFFIAT